jgi:hypothetical protein
MSNIRAKLHIHDGDGTLLFSNLSENQLSLYKNCNEASQSIKVKGIDARHGLAENESGSVYLFSQNSELAKSSKSFKKEQELVLNLLPTVIQAFKKTHDDLGHDISKIHGHNIQEIFSLIPQYNFQKQKSASDQINYIRDIVGTNPEATARALLKIIKNNSSISNEFIILSSMYSDEYILQLDSHNIYKVFHNVIVNFYNDFGEQGIFIDLGNTTTSVAIDFVTFKAALIPFFDNAVKYVFPNSTIYIVFEESEAEDYIIVKIIMLSLQIKQDERESIFSGFVGAMAKQSGKSGKGIGFSKIKNLFALSNATIEVTPNIDPKNAKNIGDLIYEENLFTFFVDKG